MNLSPSDVEQFTKAAQAFERAAAMIEKLEVSSNSKSRATITVNAGGVGVWVATTAALVMLFAGGVGAALAAAWLTREFNRIDSQFVQVQNTDQVQDAYINKLRAEQAKKEAQK